MFKPIDREQTEGQKEASASGRRERKKKRWSEKLSRNLAVTGLLALTIVSVKNQALPSGNAVLTAMQEMIDQNWDEKLGKISFVSSLFPETVSVFFDAGIQGEWIAPCFGALAHPWTEQEPYLGYRTADQKVYAIAPGQVMSVAHGPDEEKILRIRQDDGLETLYYGLGAAAVMEGDHVTSATCVGYTLPNSDAVIEVRRAGRAIDPTDSLLPREEALP